MITYTSSDDDVATVDSNGNITTKKSGSVTITAVAKVDNYNDASRSYTLNVQYVLSFNVNGGEGEVAIQTCVVKSGTSCAVKVPSNAPNKEDYFFLGWADEIYDKAATVGAGDTVDLTENETLYAIWAPIYTLEFDLNIKPDEDSDGSEAEDDAEANNEEDETTEDEGEGEEEQSVEALTCHPDITDGICSVTIPSTELVWDGHEFFGWAKRMDSIDTDYVAEQEFTFTAGEYNETLYAVWADGNITWAHGRAYTLESGEDMVLRINFPLSHFDYLAVDGEKVHENNYDLEEGSTVVTVHAEYLDTLNDGVHILAIAYDNGAMVETEFEIKKKVVVPNTGSNTENDNNGGILVITVLPAVAAVMVVVVMVVNKNRKAHRKFD